MEEKGRTQQPYIWSKNLCPNSDSKTMLYFWFQKNGIKKYRLTSEGNGRKNAHNYKTIINTIYMKPDFPEIKKIVRKM